MSAFFISLYNYFQRHRKVFWGSMFLTFALAAYFAAGIGIEENITAFFPENGNSAVMKDVFSNLKVSDKIIVCFSGEDSEEASDSLEAMLSVNPDFSASYSGGVPGDASAELISFVRDNLPVFLDDEGFAELDRLLDPAHVDSLLRNDWLTLVSPAGFAMKDIIMSDPFCLSLRLLPKTAQLNPASGYQAVDGRIYTPDGKMMLAFIEPEHATGETGSNDRLVTAIENSIGKVSAMFPNLEIRYFGGPAVGVYNARQIKKDTFLTSIVALIVIILFILAVFKRRKSVFLILCPVLYGGVVALALTSIFQDSISGIAVGAGAAIMGIALSYSIHMLAHQNHVKDVRQLLEEIASPLIIGSITTIGAFLGLLFTSSNLLRDFGLYAAFTLVGTMFFCLVFLPQFLEGSEHLKEGRILRAVERFTSRKFENSRWLLACLAVLTAICCFTSGKVRFNSDMTSLNYWDPQLEETGRILDSQGDPDVKSVLVVSTGTDEAEAFDTYLRTCARLDSLKDAGLVLGRDSASFFLVPPAEREARLARWKAWWTEERKDSLKCLTREAAVRNGFRDNAFDNAIESLSNAGSGPDYFGDVPVALSAWVGESDTRKMLISKVDFPVADIGQAYSALDAPGVVVFDQGYFANKAAENINNDFYLILYISSFLIFFVLWLSFGRIELAMLSFLPMLLSWVLIIGMMGILGVEFNIVNIILSTFIFGMGDDFSIFILEGLLHKYKTGRELLVSHKTAIFFSSFTMIVGIGALIFAGHPALHSIAVITILGMIAVVLVAYMLEPLIFNVFVTAPTSAGKPPYTLWSFVRDIYYYVPVLTGGFLLLLFGILIQALPLGRERRRSLIAAGMHRGCRLMLRVMPFIHFRSFGPEWDKIDVWRGAPGVVVANHQSSLDVFVIAALFPKVKFLVADWVVKSPLFSLITRMLGYYSKSDGYESVKASLKEDIDNGWCIAIFPEGTRSPDGKIRRFHKGAFYMASQLGVPLIPVAVYGNRRIMPKNDGFNMTEGLSVARILPVIDAGNIEYHKLTTMVESLVKTASEELENRYDSPENPYFRKALESCYIYKGPVTEWYVRVKTGLEDCYTAYNEVLPESGTITDIGCGMGQMALMLSMFRPQRRILGIDYDSSKIEVAENCWVKKTLPLLEFRCAEAMEADFPESDAFIISDMLHYLPEEQQFALLEKCLSKLRPGGVILVREGNSSDVKGQKMTALSEVMSTRVFSFNKTSGKLHFTSASILRDYAERLGMDFSEVHKNRLSANTLYQFKSTGL